MTKIALIPIDNRPVCYQLPEQIALLDKGNEIFLPDINLIGSLTKNADTDGLLMWLDNLVNIDVIVISLDTIAYGGLIPSRRSSDDFYEIKSRIEKLREILNGKNSQIYAFSSIMRISNNNFNEEEKEYWSDYGTKIFDYSYNIHKLEKTFKNIDLTSKYNAGSIPPEILKDYLLTRKRNFEINKYYIELKKQGLFDTLVFSKDDCSEFGLNVKEAEELQLLSKDINGIFIKTGADEIPVTLLSRALNKDKKIKITPVYMNPESVHKISKYEDISVKESVESQIDLAGGIISSYDETDLVMLVNNFKNEQGELIMNVYEKGFDGELKLPEKPYFISDILNANGADNGFINALFKSDFNEKFYGYSAWNTTGNTLGSGIAAALTYFGAKNPDKEAFKRLQTVRFLDDWAYQANVRSKIRDNIENLEPSILKREMKPYEDIVSQKLKIPLNNIQYTFPWNRFFEIGISQGIF